MALLHFLRPLPATLAVFLLFLAAAASAGQFLDTNPADFLAGTFSNTSVEGTGDEANVTLGGEFAANGSEQVGYWKFNENNATPFDQSGLLGWWKFDGNALDSSGNGIDGTETGGVSNATGWLNGAYEFDGSTGYIDLGNTLLVDNELTISAWAYADSLPKSYNAILGKWHSPSQIWESYNVMVQPTGAVEIGLTGGQEGEGGTGTWIYCSTTDTPFSTNAWHIVTATWKYSAGTCADMHIYVDGVEHTNGGPHNGNLASITATGPAYIGLGPGLGVSYWDGKIDNAVIYNRSLSASEVEENYLHGAATRDYSGNGNNGTSYGASWNSSGKFGGALSFDGTNDYVDAGNGAGLQLTDADFAIEVWVKFDATPVITFIFAKGTTTPPNYEGYLLAWAYGAFYNVNGNAANTIGGGCPAWSPTLGNWYHVVFTGNGTVAKTYLDGIEVCSNSYSAGYPANTAHNLMFATREDHFSYFDGLIDNAVIYNRSLSAAEVLNHYYLGAGPTHGTFEKTWDAGA
ncbi:MAG: LamG domain-containing protein, partial [Candidatus Micrarchaeota archaeon]|nr:LamG domain-containing protein [Candidatus Micrarchaeota archaeon]